MSIKNFKINYQSLKCKIALGYSLARTFLFCFLSLLLDLRRPNFLSITMIYNIAIKACFYDKKDTVTIKIHRIQIDKLLLLQPQFVFFFYLFEVSKLINNWYSFEPLKIKTHQNIIIHNFYLQYHVTPNIWYENIYFLRIFCLPWQIFISSSFNQPTQVSFLYVNIVTGGRNYIKSYQKHLLIKYLFGT